MIKDPKKFLEDILFSIERIEKMTDGLSELEFRHNIEKQDAVLRRLSVVGEAAKNLPKELTAKYPNVKWKDIIGMRDILIHEYFDIKLDRVWLAIIDNLPILKKEIIKMLKNQ